MVSSFGIGRIHIFKRRSFKRRRSQISRRIVFPGVWKSRIIEVECPQIDYNHRALWDEHSIVPELVTE